MECKPKEEGDLGIRLLEDFEVVFRLKQVWNLFTNAGSFWMACLRGNVFARKSYWLHEESNRLSQTVGSMLELKTILLDFLRCDIRYGERASFWLDA